MALTAGFVGGACTFAAGGDTGSCCPLPGKVGDRRTGMIVRVGNVNEMVRANPNLEKVSETPVRATKQAAGRDLSRVVGVVGGLAHRENRRDRMAIDAPRNEDVPMCVGRRDCV